MGTVERKASGVETLWLADCPCCGGDMTIRDCGYLSHAECNGECKRKWDLGYVDDEWGEGKQWNNQADKIRKRMNAFQLLRVDRKVSIGRDFPREELEEQAQVLLEELKSVVIGAEES